MEYKHLESQSLKVSLLKLLARMFWLNNGLRKKLDSGDFSARWMPEPPKYFYKEFVIRKKEINNHYIFTVVPKKNNSGKYILYLHGGAYVNNFAKQHWDFAKEIINSTGATFIMPDYPLAPKYTFVDTIKMVEEAYGKLLTNTDSKDIIFMGDSAGAGLALALSQKLKQENSVQPNQLILLSPWVDLNMRNSAIKPIEKSDVLLKIDSLKRAGELYAGKSDLTNYLVSPLYGSIDGLCKISIFIGTHDLLYPDCLELKIKLEENKSKFNFFEYPKMFHVWMLFIGLRESKSVLKQIVKLINP